MHNLSVVMPGLVPGTHVFRATKQGVCGRDTPGTKCPGAAMTHWAVPRDRNMHQPKAAPQTYLSSRSRSSIEMPCGPRRKQMRVPGRMVVTSLVNSTPFAFSSAATASMPLTASPK
jgi:hypothetical protein